MTGARVLVGVMLGVAEMVGVKVCVCVGVAVSVAVGGGVFVGDVVGVSVAGTGTGVERLSKGYSRMAKRTIAMPISKRGFLVITGGNFFNNLLNPVTGATDLASPSSPKSNLFKAVLYSSWTKST